MNDDTKNGGLGPWLRQGAGVWVGGGISAAAAAIACAIAAGRSWGAIVPLAFIAVLLLIAMIFGMGAGILATVLAALIFAEFLFTPTGSVRITSDVARANLAGMLLVGIGFSFLFSTPSSGIHRH